MQSQPFVRLAPDVPDLAALGAERAEDLLAEPPRVVTAQRIEHVGSLLRLPLPGTPDRSGRQHERPRGAGTGYLTLQRFGGGWAALEARFTRPRSTSLAARHWNLICHLQAAGVTTPQLVALVERPGAVSSRWSVLVTRELEGFVSAREWFAAERDERTRSRGLEALSLALAAVVRCGAWLPRTSLDNVKIQTHDSEECVALQITNLGSEQALLRERGLVRARLPAVAFTAFEGGRVRTPLGARARSAWLARLLEECRGSLTPDEAREFTSRLEPSVTR